jgi:hypothetical protein
MLSTFGESKKGCSGESYSSLMFNSDLVQCWSAMVPIPAIGLIELGMATVGRKSPLGGYAWISSPERRETAIFGHSANEKTYV